MRHKLRQARLHRQDLLSKIQRQPLRAMSHPHNSSLSTSSYSATSSRTSSLTMSSLDLLRRQSSNRGYTSAGIATCRTPSSSSYLSDDDLLAPEPASTSASDCLPPSYHTGEDAYKQRKAMQQQLRLKAFGQRDVSPKTKQDSSKK